MVGQWLPVPITTVQPLGALPVSLGSLWRQFPYLVSPPSPRNNVAACLWGGKEEEQNGRKRGKNGQVGGQRHGVPPPYWQEEKSQGG